MAKFLFLYLFVNALFYELRNTALKSLQRAGWLGLAIMQNSKKLDADVFHEPLVHTQTRNQELLEVKISAKKGVHIEIPVLGHHYWNCTMSTADRTEEVISVYYFIYWTECSPVIHAMLKPQIKKLSVCFIDKWK